MDLLCVPREPDPVSSKIPYVCKDVRWDGGQFMSYASRKGRIGSVPHHLRSGVVESDTQYLEGLYPTPREELERFYQTWFFFGLLAEFLGLNEQRNGERQVEDSLVEGQIESLYEKYCHDEAGETYLSGSIVHDNGLLIIQRFRAPGIDLKARIGYLLDCLRFTHQMLNEVSRGSSDSSNSSEFDPAIKYSIAALGEIFSTALYAFTVARPDLQLTTQNFTWAQGYIQRGGKIEAMMIKNGWCGSDVERIRSIGGLNTIHFLSRLKKPLSPKGPEAHSSCTTRSCAAFQSDPETYTPKHAIKNCHCGKMEVDLKSVFHILDTTNSYPVLHLKLSEDFNNIEISVEPYVPDVPYVALSHVWADGLGDHKQNALHICQIRNLAQLIANIPRAVQTASSASTEQTSYRLWIDTLCCPIERERKKIALNRITSVYRNATHVLVLDSSLSSYKAINADPAETLLRVFYSAAWMRRLWTLQEGFLAKSLYFQFADAPVKAYDQIVPLYLAGTKDARYMRIFLDIAREMTLLRAFENLANPEDRAITVVQQALHFRSVTDPFDEALCLATLLSLDITEVYSIKTAAKDPQDAATINEDAMACVWKQLAKSKWGGISARIIFYVDNPLRKVGWRWAPRSLLDSGPGSHVSLAQKIQRFAPIKGAKMLDIVAPVHLGVPEYLGDPESSGVPDSLGLRVQFPGLRLQVRSRVDGILHPWNGIIEPCEDYLLFRDSGTGKWFRILDGYRSSEIGPLPVEKRAEYDRAVNNPLCKLIDSGDCALICDESFDGMQPCLLVQVIIPESGESSDPTQMQPLRARSQRQVITVELNTAEVLVAETVLKIADELATEDITDLKQLRVQMQTLMADTWKTNPDFVEAVRNTMNRDQEEIFWKQIPKLFSHDIYSDKLPDDQVWIVD